MQLGRDAGSLGEMQHLLPCILANIYLLAVITEIDYLIFTTIHFSWWELAVYKLMFNINKYPSQVYLAVLQEKSCPEQNTLV